MTLSCTLITAISALMPRHCQATLLSPALKAMANSICARVWMWISGHLHSYGNNLTNEDAVTIGFNTEIAARLAPRTIGFDVAYTF